MSDKIKTALEYVGSVGTASGGLMLLDPTFAERVDPEELWREAAEWEEFATVGPIDPRTGQPGIDCAFFYLAGAPGVLPVYASRGPRGEITRLEIRLDQLVPV